MEVVVEGKPPVKYSLDELMAFPSTTVEATIQCAGNRRNEMSKIKAVKVLAERLLVTLVIHSC